MRVYAVVRACPGRPSDGECRGVPRLLFASSSPQSSGDAAVYTGTFRCLQQYLYVVHTHTHIPYSMHSEALSYYRIYLV